MKKSGFAVLVTVLSAVAALTAAAIAVFVFLEKKKKDEEELEPGAVRICSGTGAVRLDEDGLALNGDTVALEGDITVNGQGLESYIRSIVYDVLASMMG